MRSFHIAWCLFSLDARLSVGGRVRQDKPGQRRWEAFTDALASRRTSPVFLRKDFLITHSLPFWKAKRSLESWKGHVVDLVCRNMWCASIFTLSLFINSDCRLESSTYSYMASLRVICIANEWLIYPIVGFQDNFFFFNSSVVTFILVYKGSFPPSLDQLRNRTSWLEKWGSQDEHFLSDKAEVENKTCGHNRAPQ